MLVDLITEKDMLFIKKYALGLFFNKIKKDLFLKSNEELYQKKQTIKLKLKITNDLDLIKEAFNIGLIVTDHFVLKNLHDISFGIAYNIYMENQQRQKPVENIQHLYMKVYDTYLSIYKMYKIN